MADDRQQIIDEFDRAVNMTPKELEEWLQTEESRSVGQSDGGGESKGHESGRRIVEIKHKNEARLHRQRHRTHEEGQQLRQAPPRSGTQERPRGL